MLEGKADKGEVITMRQWNVIEKRIEDSVNTMLEDQDSKLKEIDIRTADLQGKNKNKNKNKSKI